MISFDSAILRVSGIDPVGAASSLSSAASASTVNATSGAGALGNALSAPNGSGATAGVEGMGGAGGASATNMPAPASAESTERFRQMLDQASLTVQSDPNVSQGHSSLSTIVQSQDDALNNLSSSIETFQQNASTMDSHAFTATMVRMQFQMADAMAKIQLGVGFAQGGKSAVQSLMKNQ